MEYVLWGLTLPQIIRYFEARSARIERQNAATEDNSTGSADIRQPATPSQADAKARQVLERRRKYEESINPDNAPPLSEVFGAFSGPGWSQ